eukprot:TCALIF_10663-PA protein Name:"Protein of unknown function" AED:0.06 eAED:0.06 QI:0/0.5/0.33/0.66/1/1/3/232/262
MPQHSRFYKQRMKTGRKGHPPTGIFACKTSVIGSLLYFNGSHTMSSGQVLHMSSFLILVFLAGLIDKSASYLISDNSPKPVAAAAAAVTGIQCFVGGECLDSLIVDVTPTNTSSMCLHHCQQTRGCEWFTYYKDTKLCASLSVCLRLNQTICGDNCVSGEDECPEFYCGVKGKCLGALEGMRLVETVDECKAKCNAEARCKWHSFDPSTKVCSMTADCPALDAKCETCIASERACETGQVSVPRNNTLMAVPQKYAKVITKK